MGVGLAIGIFFICSTIISLAIVAIIIKYKEQKDPEDDVIVRTYLTQYTHGYHEGKLERTFIKNNRVLVEFTPFLSKKEKEKKRIRELKPEKFVVRKECIENLPRGILDSWTAYMICHPSSMKDYPEEYKNTIYGKMLMKNVEEIDLENFKDDINKKKEATIKDIGMQIGGGILTRKMLKTIMEGVEDLKKTLTTQRSFPQFTSQYPSPKDQQRRI